MKVVRMIVFLLIKFFLLYLCIRISAVFLYMFDVSANSGKIIFPESANLEQAITVVALSSLIPFLLLFLTFKRDIKLLIISYVILVFYFLCLHFNLTIGSFQNALTGTIEVQSATALMLVLLMLNFIHLIYPIGRIKPLLKLLPVLSFIWLYSDMVLSSLSMLIGNLAFGFYDFEEVIMLAVHVDTLPFMILLSVVMPLTVFFISKYIENIGEFLSMIFQTRK